MTSPLPGAATRTSLPLTDVTLDDAFWAPRQRIVREHTLPHQEHHLRTGGQFDALTLTWRAGDPNPPHPFWDSDVAKWIEAASYSLATTPDAALEASVDEAIALLAGAQQPDGYLNSYFTLTSPSALFSDLHDAHELYSAGHLIEAGVAHFEATGKTSLLDVVTRLADLIDRETRPGGRIEGGYDGHEEIELALVKLARATGERRYLDLSARLIDSRGTEPYYFDAERERRGDEGWAAQFFEDRPRRRQFYREYCQAHLPVREQRSVVGHAVRAMYLYSAMADLAGEHADDSLRRACEALWEDLVSHKLYVTGGIGGDHSIEGFGPAFSLPDKDAYAETCASIGLVLWAHRMMLLTGEGRYVDVLERALYNGVISGCSLSGTEFFYGNPLASDGGVQRQDWFGVACCPPNYARLMTSLGRYLYARDEEGVYVNLYATGSAVFTHGDTRYRVTQETDVPWGGEVRVEIYPEHAGRQMSLRLRIPDWAETHRIRVRDEEVPAEVVDGYVAIDRAWDVGDTVTLTLEMRPRAVAASSKVRELRGRVAYQCGPLVYAFEEADNGGPVRDLRADEEAEIRRTPHASLPVTALLVEGARLDPQDTLYATTPLTKTPTALTAIPYFAWANRGPGSMEVWVPTD